MSASTFNSSEVFMGSHEFTIPNFSSVQKMYCVGESIESGAFSIGGDDWIMRVFPSGYDREGFIGMCLCRLTPPAFNGWVMASFKIDDPSGQRPPLIRFADACFQGTALIDLITTKACYVRYDGSLTIHCNIKSSKGYSYATSTTAAAAAVGARATTTIIPPSSNIACHLEQLLVTAQFSDVKFQVQDSEIWAHELVIAARSPILHQAVSSAPDKDHVRIQEISFLAFQAMLHFIYADELPLIMAGDATAAAARDLLVAADRFGLDRMKAMCENMLCENVTAENVVATLELANHRRFEGLKEFCIEHISQPHVLKEVVETKSFKDLKATSPSLLEEIIMKISKLSSIS
jgi:speckle-type POZ protein